MNTPETQAAQACYAHRDSQAAALRYNLYASAAHALRPEGVTIMQGDACAALVASGSQPAVLTFTVFSSLLNAGYREEVCWCMTSRWTPPQTRHAQAAPGGARHLLSRRAPAFMPAHAGAPAHAAAAGSTAVRAAPTA